MLYLLTSSFFLATEVFTQGVRVKFRIASLLQSPPSPLRETLCTRLAGGTCKEVTSVIVSIDNLITSFAIDLEIESIERLFQYKKCVLNVCIREYGSFVYYFYSMIKISIIFFLRLYAGLIMQKEYQISANRKDYRQFDVSHRKKYEDDMLIFIYK